MQQKNYLLGFMILRSLIMGTKQADYCGTITTVSGDTIVLHKNEHISIKNFEKIYEKKLGNASFYLNENCRIKLCGFRSYSVPHAETDGCVGSNSDLMDCILFRKNSSQSDDVNEHFMVSSLSCGCENRKHIGCDANCTAKRQSANSNNNTWKTNECAILFRENRCQDCYYKPIKLKQGEEFRNDIVHHINSIIVRDECTVSEEVPGFKRLCNFKDRPEKYTYNSTDNEFSVRSAFLRDFREVFSCSCRTNIIVPPPALPPSTAPIPPSPEPAETIHFKIILGVICVGLVAALITSVGLFISRRRQILLLRSKRTLAVPEFNNAEGIGHPIEFLYDTNVHNFSLNSSYEICSEHFQLGVESLGGGHFGEVTLGSLKVAVKTVRKNTKDEMLSKQSLKHEIKILSYLGSHENVIRFLGASVNLGENGEIFLITEYCQHGSLKDYLTQRIRPHVEDIIRTEMLKGLNIADDGYPETGYACNIEAKLKDLRENLTHDLEKLDPATSTRFMQWSAEIANGMEYITFKKVVHVDLAARNVLLTHNLTAKIGDFGLSKKIYLKEYVNSKKDYFPILWVAPESLTQSKYSSKSDIWAYGVTLWEIFSLGMDPYDEMSSMEEILGAIIQGKGLNRAEFASDYVHSKLTECWKENPDDRPSFPDLKEYFSLGKTQI